MNTAGTDSQANNPGPPPPRTPPPEPPRQPIDREPPDRIVRRRAVALTAITALIVVPAALLLSQIGGGGDEGKSAGSRDLIIPATPHGFTDKKNGIIVRWPDGWKLKRSRGAITLRSEDKTTGFVIAATRPSTGRAARSEFKNAILALQEAYRKEDTKLVKNSQPLSGLATASASITGTNAKGVKQKVAVIVARGHKHVYLIEIIAPARGGRTGEVAVIGRRLQLRG